jgi:hypothetical protein
MSWVFNNDVFTNYDWTQEPDLTIDELYNRRARELRERYDYIVLNYSGGSDSHNVLMSFYRQGLHIDEVATNWILDASKDVTINDTNVTQAWNQNAEYDLHTRERLEWVKNHMPNTKISVYDCSKEVLEYFIRAKDESWVIDKIDALNPAAIQRYNYLNVKEIRKRIDHEQSVCIISGIDKPRCDVVDNKLYMIFSDKRVNIAPVQQHLDEYTNTTLEYFYWSPECCEMLAKQCHLLLKFLKANKKYVPMWNGLNQWNAYGQDRLIQDSILRGIVYTNWDTGWFQASKPTKDWDCELDYWFFEGYHDTVAGRNWRAGLNYLEKNVDPRFFATHIRGLAQMLSPKYYIGDI